MRTLWVGVVAAVVTPFYGSVIALYAFLMPRRIECRCERWSRAWAGAIVRAAGIELKVVGMDRLKADRPHIIVSNHQSWFDVLSLMGALPRGTRFVAKKELRKIPWFGRAWQACGHISIDRRDRGAAVESLRTAGRLIRERSSNIVMFAEGTRSGTGELQPFKKGAFVLAIEGGVPVLPIAVKGSRDVMPKGSFKIRAGSIEIRVGEAIDVTGMTLSDRDDLRDRTWRAVATLREEALDRLGSQIE